MATYHGSRCKQCRSHGIPCICLAGRYFPAMERIPRDFFHDGVHLSQRLMPLALEELARVGELPIPGPGQDTALQDDSGSGLRKK